MDTTDTENSIFYFFEPLANLLIIFGFLLITFLPYIETEINGFLHYNYKENLSLFCQEDSLPEPNNIKIISVKKYRFEINFYCFYENESLDQKIVLQKTNGKWQVHSKQNFRQAGGFYWPIYVNL